MKEQDTLDRRRQVRLLMDLANALEEDGAAAATGMGLGQGGSALCDCRAGVERVTHARVPVIKCEQPILIPALKRCA
jgi:hypothetical protein